MMITGGKFYLPLLLFTKCRCNANETSASFCSTPPPPPFFFFFFSFPGGRGRGACCCLLLLGTGRAAKVGESTVETKTSSVLNNPNKTKYRPERHTGEFSCFHLTFCCACGGRQSWIFTPPGVVPDCVSPSNQRLSVEFTWEEMPGRKR